MAKKGNLTWRKYPKYNDLQIISGSQPKKKSYIIWHFPDTDTSLPDNEPHCCSEDFST